VNATRDSDVPRGDGIGPSVLNVAISHAPPSLVKQLVQAGASLDRRYLGHDAVEYAEWCGRPDLVPVLKPVRRRAVHR
jgi:hypothetical protein